MDVMRSAYGKVVLGIFFVSACSPTEPAPAASPEAEEATGSVEQPAEASAEPTPEPPARAVSGDNCSEAIPLHIDQNGGASVVGSIDGKTNSFDAEVPVTNYAWSGADVFYRVDLAANDVLRVGVGDNGSFDSGSYVFTDCGDPAGSAIGGADTTASDVFYEAQAPAAGTYYIAVDAYAGAMTGGYELVAFRFPENPAADPTPADTCAAAEAVRLPLLAFSTLDGGTNSHGEMVTPTGYAWDGVDQFWAFDLEAGQTLHISVDDNGSFDAGWYLFTDCNDIAGSTLYGADSFSGGPVSAAPIPSAGRYYLAVDAFAGATSGGYQVLVY